MTYKKYKSYKKYNIYRYYTSYRYNKYKQAGVCLKI